MSKKKKSGSKIATKGGVYSLIIIAIVLAIIVMLNVLSDKIPTNLTKFDISAQKLYSVTSNTKAVVLNLHQNVTIYWIVQANEEDSVIENLLSRYNDLSDHITLEKINPDIRPTFVANYTDETVQNNSIVVESGNRYRYIPYSDIYVTKTTTNYYTTTSETFFDGEGAITSAIDYVVTTDLPVLYVLQGHGEKEIDADFAEAIQKGNIETVTFSLLNVTEIPEEADAVLINAPQSDISEKELEILRDYLTEKGKLLVFSGPTEDGTELTNLNALLKDYDVIVEPGIVVEADSSHYMANQYGVSPVWLMPIIQDTEITASQIKNNYYVIVPIASGVKLGPTANTEDVITLLSTSDIAYAKAAGYKMKSYEKEEGDADGPFALALLIKNYHGGQIAWFASSDMVSGEQGTYANTLSSGANMDLAMSALNKLIGERDAIAIPSKSMKIGQLTISEDAKTTLKVVMLGVFPLVIFGIGIVVLLWRRRMQNEKV